LREAERLRLNSILHTELPSSHGAVLIDADAMLDCSPPGYSSLLPDLLHLSPDGYRRLGNAFRSASAAIAAR
jgi:lysophospholipase L1-like esterase